MSFKPSKHITIESIFLSFVLKVSFFLFEALLSHQPDFISFSNNGVTMIPFNDFNFSERTKPTLGKHPFSLTLEQLSFLCLLSEKLHLTDDELMLVEYLTNNECRSISLNRFRDLQYDCVALAAVLYLFDLRHKDYIEVLFLIDSLYSGAYAAESTKSKVYGIYRNLYNTYLNVEIVPDLYQNKRGALKLKQ